MRYGSSSSAAYVQYALGCISGLLGRWVSSEHKLKSFAPTRTSRCDFVKKTAGSMPDVCSVPSERAHDATEASRKSQRGRKKKYSPTKTKSRSLLSQDLKKDATLQKKLMTRNSHHALSSSLLPFFLAKENDCPYDNDKDNNNA